MSRNSTAAGVGEKGSKLWMQAIVNPDEVDLLSKLKIDSDTLNMYKDGIQEKLGFDTKEWISPIADDNYCEYKLNQNKHKNIRETVLELDKKTDLYKTLFKFWPSQQPVWDAMAIHENKAGCKQLFLFEAKAYREEAKTKCGSKSKENIALIEKSMLSAYNYYTNKSYTVETWKEKDIWMNTYYQLGNRLTFLYYMNEKLKNIQTTLVLLNVVKDKTFNPVPKEDDWKEYYEKAFKKMIGCPKPPKNVKVLLVNGSKGIELLWN